MKNIHVTVAVEVGEHGRARRAVGVRVQCRVRERAVPVADLGAVTRVAVEPFVDFVRGARVPGRSWVLELDAAAALIAKIQIEEPVAVEVVETEAVWRVALAVPGHARVRGWKEDEFARAVPRRLVQGHVVVRARGRERDVVPSVAVGVEDGDGLSADDGQAAGGVAEFVGVRQRQRQLGVRKEVGQRGAPPCAAVSGAAASAAPASGEVEPPPHASALATHRPANPQNNSSMHDAMRAP